MAPWSNRILSPSSRNEPSPVTPGTSTASPARTRGPSRVTEADILENAYGIPTLQTGGGSAKPTQTGSHGRSHGRSMSHPFPSLFTGKKKRNGDNAGGFESTDDDTISPATARNLAHNPTAKQPKVLDKDLMTGKCMTCDSMVRWPKELKVFRCTVCLTINDLKPIILEARHGDGHRTPVTQKAGTYPVTPYHRRS